MEVNINNELAIAEYKLLIVSRFLNSVENFSDDNLIDFFRLLSPSEQYYLFDKLSEEQKLMILSKINVLSPDVYIACCKKTYTFKNNISLSNTYDKLKRWRKDFKAEDEFGKKIALLIAILESNKNKEQLLEKILVREKYKRNWKKFLFFGVFAFCSASFGIGGFVGGFFAVRWLAFVVENSIVLSAATLGAVGYSKLQESYLRESKLIKMLNWMKENEVFKKNNEVFKKNNEIPVPPIIKYLNEKNNEIDTDKIEQNVDTNNVDINEYFFKIGELKEKKSKLKKVIKILFYISIFLSFAAAIGSLLFIPGAVTLMPFAVSMLALKISVGTLAISAISTFIISKFLHIQVQEKREAIKKLGAESPLIKDFSEETFEKAAENLPQKPNLENENKKENTK